MAMRHNRLWSIAGISNILSRMNEIEMRAIAGNHKGDVIVATRSSAGAHSNSLPIENALPILGVIPWYPLCEVSKISGWIFMMSR